MTKCQTELAWTTKNLIFFRALEVEHVRSGCWCLCSGSGDSSLLACRGFILLFSHIMERGQCLFLLFLRRPQSYWFRAPSLWPHLTWIISSYSTLRVVASTHEFWWGDTSQYTASFNFLKFDYIMFHTNYWKLHLRSRQQLSLNFHFLSELKFRFVTNYIVMRSFQVALVVRNPPTNAGDKRHGLRRSFGGGKAIHSSILAWRIPLTEKPGGLQSVGSQRVRHDWSDLAHTYILS